MTAAPPPSSADDIGARHPTHIRRFVETSDSNISGALHYRGDLALVPERSYGKSGGSAMSRADIMRERELVRTVELLEAGDHRLGYQSLTRLIENERRAGVVYSVAEQIAALAKHYRSAARATPPLGEDSLADDIVTTSSSRWIDTEETKFSVSHANGLFASPLGLFASPLGIGTFCLAYGRWLHRHHRIYLSRQYLHQALAILSEGRHIGWAAIARNALSALDKEDFNVPS